MSINDVKSALAEEKAAIMNVKVLRRISSTTYVIGDKSAMAILEVEDTAAVKEGNFIKLVKPSIKDNIIHKNSKFNILKGKCFKHDFQSEDVDAICKKHEKTDNSVKLMDVQNKHPSSIVPSLTLKVCSVSKPYKGKFSEYKNILAKDVTGDKVTIVLYKKLKDSCELGKVYDFYTLKKTDYKAEGENNYRMSSLSDTKIEEVFGERMAKFDAVNVGDNVVVGDFVGKYILSIFLAYWLNQFIRTQSFPKLTGISNISIIEKIICR